MKKYEKPIVLINEEVAEGVYAASGDVVITPGQSVEQDQEYDFEFDFSDIDTDKDSSKEHRVEIDFNHAIKDADFGYGNTVRHEVNGCKLILTFRPADFYDRKIKGRLKSNAGLHTTGTHCCH